jgi:hypothetical protein
MVLSPYLSRAGGALVALTLVSHAMQWLEARPLPFKGRDRGGMGYEVATFGPSK